jgi:hypothetical protein
MNYFLVQSLIEADISINRGGRFKPTTSVNTLTEVVALGQPPRLISIN